MISHLSHKIEINPSFNNKDKIDKFLNLIGDAVLGEVKRLKVIPWRTGQLQRTSYVKSYTNYTDVVFPAKYAKAVWDMEARLGKKINWTTYYNKNAREKWVLAVTNDQNKMQRIIKFSLERIFND